MDPYSYVGNNPIMFTDPTGMSAEPPPGSNYAQGHRHTDEEGTKWQLNGSVWENRSGGEDQWQSETLSEVVVNADNRSIGKKIADGIMSEVKNAVQAIESDNNRMLSKVSSGVYSPLSGAGSGMSLSMNIFGNTIGLSMAGEHYKGWEGTNLYMSYSGGHDLGFWEGIKKNTSFKKFISTSVTFDTYHNNGFEGSFDAGVQGYSNDRFGGYGGFTGGYSQPYDVNLNSTNPRAGLYKSSVGASTSGFSVGTSLTRTVNIKNL